MSRGNYFVSLRTNHYLHVPEFYRFGMSYIDGYCYNVLRNTSNPIAQRAKEITSHVDVNIYDNQSLFAAWIRDHLGVESFSWTYFNSTGDIHTDTINTWDTSNVNIGTLINYVESTTYEQRGFDLENQNAQAKKLLQIQSSLEGYAVGTSSKNHDVRIYFPQPNANRTDRTAATKGSSLISSVPRLASGKKFHLDATDNAEVGTYVTSNELSEDDTAATVAGTLKLRWNKNLNVWDAGQTFLAVLLSDVDGADITNVGFDIGNIEAVSKDQFYGSEAAFGMFDFTTGIAMPMGLESSHPQSFGPNILKCKDSTKLETIRVVNRSRTNYSNGEIVIIHQIDGENIIGGKFTEDVVEQRPPQPGRWNFTKFFANSDEYFRLRYGSNSGGSDQGRPSINPHGLVMLLFQKYYNEKTGTIKSLNIFEDTELPIDSSFINNFELFEYYQSKIEDLEPTIGRINIYDDPSGEGNVAQQRVGQEEVPIFFGPMFPDGVNLKVGNYNKMHTPGERVYPWTYDAHNAVRKINRKQYYNGVGTGYTASGIISVADPFRVQFSLCSCELLGAADSTSNQLNENLQSHKDRFGPDTNLEVRKFQKTLNNVFTTYNNKETSVLQLTKRDNFPDSFTSPAAERRGTDGHDASARVNTNFNLPQSLNYQGLTNSADITQLIPYDAYIKYIPLNTPIGAPTVFGGDVGPESLENPYMGSNAVGITSSRLRLNQGSGGSFQLTAEVNQNIGMKGRYFGGGMQQGGILPTVIGAFLHFATDTRRDREINGRVALWGSSRDYIDSFGTAACHVQVWDAWPDALTTWIPQYMCSLHFNPSPASDEGSVIKALNFANAEKDSDGNWAKDKEPEDFEINVPALCEVSYQVPTYGATVDISYTNDDNETITGTYPAYGVGQDGDAVGAGNEIFQSTVLRPSTQWLWATHRHGKLVTQYGYRYYQTVIGLSQFNVSLVDYDDDTTPSDFQTGEENIYSVGTGDRKANFYFTSSIPSEKNKNVSIKFVENEVTINDNTKKSYQERGQGWLPESLPFEASIEDSNGVRIVIKFTQLRTHQLIKIDAGPQPRTPLTRVSMKSGSGQDWVYGDYSTTLQVEGNKTGIGENPNAFQSRDLELYGGQYEVLVYVHNDVALCWHEIPEITSGSNLAQYITVKFR